MGRCWHRQANAIGSDLIVIAVREVQRNHPVFTLHQWRRRAEGSWRERSRCHDRHRVGRCSCACARCRTSVPCVLRGLLGNRYAARDKEAFPRHVEPFLAARFFVFSSACRGRTPLGIALGSAATRNSTLCRSSVCASSWSQPAGSK